MERQTFTLQLFDQSPLEGDLALNVPGTLVPDRSRTTVVPSFCGGNRHPELFLEPTLGQCVSSIRGHKLQNKLGRQRLTVGGEHSMEFATSISHIAGDEPANLRQVYLIRP